MSFNGTEDPLVNYTASQQSMDAWVTRNGCTGAPERSNYCWPANPIVLPGFCASGGLADIDANKLMYDVLENTALP